jgi:uncharacterized protein YceK
MKKFFFFFIFSTILAMCSGCGTLVERIGLFEKSGDRKERYPYHTTIRDITNDSEMFVINFFFLLSTPIDFAVDTFCLPYDFFVWRKYAKLEREKNEKREKVKNSLVGGWICESPVEKSSFIYLDEGGLWFSVNFPITSGNESVLPEIGLMSGKWNAVMRHEERKEIRIVFYTNEFAYEKKSFQFHMDVHLDDQISEQRLRILRIGTRKGVKDTTTGAVKYVDDNHDKNFLYRRL